MSSLKAAKLQLNKQWQHTLSDYVTAVAYAPADYGSVVATAAGEVVLFEADGNAVSIQAASGHAVSSLSFAADGSFCVWGGQKGVLTIWDVHQQTILRERFHHNVWIDKLTCHPSRPLVAYGVGSTVQIWDVRQSAPVAELDFGASSVLHIAWHPTGDRLAISGHGGVKVWSNDDWDAAPKLIAVPGASLYCAWSTDGRYLGSGNLDRTLTVAEWNSPPPWLMQGFPGKVRQVAWSTIDTSSGSPLIAAVCVEGITVWERGDKPKVGWQSQVLQHHKNRVNAIAWQPNSFLLASAGQDSQIALWRQRQKPEQSVKAFAQGVSCLTWSPDGDRLLAGGNAGEVAVWRVAQRGQGFG